MAQLGPATRVTLLVASYVIIACWVFLASRGPEMSSTQSPSQHGHMVWREQGCGSCHALFGLGGHAGPDLTNAIRRRGRDYIDAAIVHGLGRMPPQDVDAEDRAALLDFLAHLDGLGTYPLPGFPDEAFGRTGVSAGHAPQHRGDS